MSESFAYHISICHSKSPRLKGYGCCLDKGSEAVMSRLLQLIEQHGLAATVRVRPSNCLKNCHQGVSLQVVPGPTYYGHVGVEEIKGIVEEHLQEGREIEALRVPNPNSMY